MEGKEGSRREFPRIHGRMEGIGCRWDYRVKSAAKGSILPSFPRGVPTNWTAESLPSSPLKLRDSSISSPFGLPIFQGIRTLSNPSTDELSPNQRSQIMSQQIIQTVERPFLKEKVDQFEIGDTVDVHTKIQEGAKERIQIFTGTVIAKSGSGAREMFVVRRIVAGEGVERKFPLHSPKIEKIEVQRKSVVRRAKLYFLRERIGKGVRLRERRER